MGGGVFDRPKKRKKEKEKEKFIKEYSASTTHLFLVLAMSPIQRDKLAQSVPPG
jgi:hypothetical protein